MSTRCLFVARTRCTGQLLQSRNQIWISRKHYYSYSRLVTRFLVNRIILHQGDDIDSILRVIWTHACFMCESPSYFKTVKDEANSYSLLQAGYAVTQDFIHVDLHSGQQCFWWQWEHSLRLSPRKRMALVTSRHVADRLRSSMNTWHWMWKEHARWTTSKVFALLDS